MHALLLGAALLLGVHAPNDLPRRVSLEVAEVSGCPGLPRQLAPRELWIAGERAADRSARFWDLDRARAYVAGRSDVRYRVGDGTLLVHSELADDLGSERVRVEVERPIAAPYREVYLAGLELPCERRLGYRVQERPAEPGDVSEIERFDALLQQAEELGYDARFDESLAKLREARALRPGDSAPYWMMARERYLQLEEQAASLSAQERVGGYREAESWADRAVELVPDRAEGYLWQGILRGRITTAQGNFRVALAVVTGQRGPRWLERTLRQATTLEQDFRFFGSSTRANALHSLAQFYRLAPDAWYMAAVGTRGDIDRAIELSRRAIALQPARIDFRVELAVERLCRGASGDRGEAVTVLRAARELPAVTTIDRMDQVHARLLLQDSIPDVCWYSRDAVEEATAWAR